MKYFINFLFSVVLFSGQLDAQCSGNQTINSINNNGTVQNYYAPNTITSPLANTSNTVYISGSTNVTYQAGNTIYLEPGASGAVGFRANHASGGGPGVFVAKIDYPHMLMIEPTGTSNVGKYEKIEIGLEMPSDINTRIDDFFKGTNNSGGPHINPYDPDWSTFNSTRNTYGIDVEANFTAPSGAQKTIYGFYYREYVRNTASPDDNVLGWTEVATPYHFRVRYAPDEIGTWTYTITVNYKDISGNTLALQRNCNSFNCVSSSNKGYLKIGSSNRYLVYSGTGEGFFPIGQNVAFANNAANVNATSAPSDFDHLYNTLNDIGTNGGNFTRVMMAPWSYGIEWETLNNYDGRQMHAWELDKYINTAKSNGIYAILCMDMTNPFTNSISGFWSQYDMWSNNPYKSSNQNLITGVNDPGDFFIDGSGVDATDYYRKKLRYIVSRWGYSTNIAAYEFLNEINSIGTDHLIAPTIYQYDNNSTVRQRVRDWHINNASYIKNATSGGGLGDTRHLITTSQAGACPRCDNGSPYSDPSDDVFSSSAGSQMDFTSYHNYDNVSRNIEHRAFSRTKDYLAAYNKPFLMEEMNPPPPWVNGGSFHDALWATALSGAFGAGLDWWWDWSFRSDFIPLKSFLSGIDFNVYNFVGQKYPVCTDNDLNNGGCGSSDNANVEAFVVKNASSTLALGWIKNRTDYWFNRITIPSSCALNTFYNSVDGIRYEFTGNTASYCTSAATTSSCIDDARYISFDSSKPMPNKDYPQACYWIAYPDDNYTDPLTSVNENVTLTQFSPNTKYSVSWFNTRGTGGAASIPNTIVTSDASGNLIIPSPTLGAAPSTNPAPDYAFKIVPCSSCKLVTGIDNLNNDVLFKIVPNPNSGKFSVINGDPADFDIYIYNTFGQLIFSQTKVLSKETEIDISNQAKGIYVIKITNASGTRTQKIINE